MKVKLAWTPLSTTVQLLFCLIGILLPGLYKVGYTMFAQYLCLILLHNTLSLNLWTIITPCTSAKVCATIQLLLCLIGILLPGDPGLCLSHSHKKCSMLRIFLHNLCTIYLRMCYFTASALPYWDPTAGPMSVSQLCLHNTFSLNLCTVIPLFDTSEKTRSTGQIFWHIRILLQGLCLSLSLENTCFEP